MSDSKTVVLAFSGGLDTSYCLLDLKKRGYIVHTQTPYTARSRRSLE
jgi:argininosuccinate synthase